MRGLDVGIERYQDHQLLHREPEVEQRVDVRVGRHRGAACGCVPERAVDGEDESGCEIGVHSVAMPVP